MDTASERFEHYQACEGCDLCDDGGGFDNEETQCEEDNFYPNFIY